MKIKHNVVPIQQQDKLEEGLLRADDGSYLSISRQGKRIDNFWERFAETNEQDKLKQGLIKIDRTEDYISVDNLGEIENDDCFIATAIYGNRDAPQVQTLRDFKDDVLMRSAAGRLFVGFYYSGAGKRTADIVNEHLPSTIPILRRGLDFLVERYSAQRR